MSDCAGYDLFPNQCILFKQNLWFLISTYNKTNEVLRKWCVAFNTTWV